MYTEDIDIYNFFIEISKNSQFGKNDLENLLKLKKENNLKQINIENIDSTGFIKKFIQLVKFIYNNEYQSLNEYRKFLLNSKTSIEVTDFGAGSRVFKSNTRAINQIAKNAGISPKRAELLFRITRYFQPETILEIGTSLGLATSALSLGNSNAKIITLEGCPNTINQCQLQLQKFNINNVECINTKFEDYLKTYNLKPTTHNLIYFDGNH
jgi:hypothetical protein